MPLCPVFHPSSTDLFQWREYSRVTPSDVATEFKKAKNGGATPHSINKSILEKISEEHTQNPDSFPDTVRENWDLLIEPTLRHSAAQLRDAYLTKPGTYAEKHLPTARLTAEVLSACVKHIPDAAREKLQKQYTELPVWSPTAEPTDTAVEQLRTLSTKLEKRSAARRVYGTHAAATMLAGVLGNWVNPEERLVPPRQRAWRDRRAGGDGTLRSTEQRRNKGEALNTQIKETLAALSSGEHLNLKQWQAYKEQVLRAVTPFLSTVEGGARRGAPPVSSPAVVEKNVHDTVADILGTIREGDWVPISGRSITTHAANIASGGRHIVPAQRRGQRSYTR